MDRSYRPLAFTLGGLGVFAALFVLGSVTGWWSAAENEQAIGEISRWCERVGGGIESPRVSMKTGAIQVSVEVEC